MIALALLLACTSDKPGESGESDIEAIDPRAARVFSINPVATPDPVDVILDDVADDGNLTSSADSQGLRRLDVLSCIDRGDTVSIMGWGDLRICSLEHRADASVNGSFVYEDWDSAVHGLYDVDDIHAEVALYHHVSRAYDLVVSSGLDSLPDIHEVGETLVPLTVVANYRWPADSTASALPPYDAAFQLSHADLAMGMDAFAGLPDIPGDVMAFGQGEHADFAYDGETVYHEFGHVLARAVAGRGPEIVADAWGLSNQSNAMNEGLADTFAALVSGRPTLYDYLGAIGGDGWERDLTGDPRFPDDITGLDVLDGQVLAAANWEAFQRFDGSAPEAYLGSLSKLGTRDAFVDWVAALPAELMDVFAERGLDVASRVKDITAYRASDGEMLYVGGAAEEPWNTWLDVTEGNGDAYALSTAMIQTAITPGSDVGEIVLSACLMAMAGSSDWDLRLFWRNGEQVLYESDGTWSVTRDGEVLPTITEDASCGGPKATWILSVRPGQVVTTHFVNRGADPVLLMGLDVDQ